MVFFLTGRRVDTINKYFMCSQLAKYPNNEGNLIITQPKKLMTLDIAPHIILHREKCECMMCSVQCTYMVNRQRPRGDFNGNGDL